MLRSDEKSFQYAKRMFPLFRAIVKSCLASTMLERIIIYFIFFSNLETVKITRVVIDVGGI